MKPPTETTSRTWAQVLACAALQISIACSHPDDGAPLHRTAPGPKEAGLSVDITPATGISVGLDGNKVASQGPYQTFELEPGAHTLLVRGMGYLPVEMPITLTAGQTLKVAVSLRARPLEPEPSPEPSAPPPPRRTAPRPSEAKAPPKAQESPKVGPDLPAGTAPVVLEVVPQPETAISVDETPQTNKTLTLRHTYGTVTIGTLKIRYSISADRTLEFTLPEDAASWKRDTLDVAPGSVLKFSRGFTRLRRQGTEGDSQSVIMRWSDKG